MIGLIYLQIWLETVLRENGLHIMMMRFKNKSWDFLLKLLIKTCRTHILHREKRRTNLEEKLELSKPYQWWKGFLPPLKSPILLNYKLKLTHWWWNPNKNKAKNSFLKEKASKWNKMGINWSWTSTTRKKLIWIMLRNWKKKIKSFNKN